VAGHDQPAAAPGVDASFAAQQLAAGTEAPLVPDGSADAALALVSTAGDDGQERWPEGEIPSRYGPGAVSFTGLFTNEAAIPGRTLMTVPGEPVGGALFLQLYGQGQVSALAPLPVGPVVAPVAEAEAESDPASPLDLVAPATPVRSEFDPLAPLPEPLPLTAP
jgi:hypothetical protein